MKRALFAAMLIGCGGPKVTQGTLHGPEIAVASVPRKPQITLFVAPPVDARPADEHEGASVRTKLFVFFLFGVHIKREGNYLTNDFAATADASGELHALAVQHLAAAGVAKKVTAKSAGDFDLKLTIEHLYGTHFAANKQTIVVVNSNRSTDAVVDVHAHNYAAYGNVTLKAELIDRRGGGAKPVWTEHVTGYSQRPADEARVREVQFAVQLATSDALATLSQRVSAALDRLGVGPSGPPMMLSAAGSFPTTFAIDRMSRYRDFLERVYVETASGRVIRHEIMPAPDRYASRPGDWVLSRVTAEGVQLSPEGYEMFARSLAGRYDLRQVDDATHYHFFGILGAVP
jgi:hypothetical protein